MKRAFLVTGSRDWTNKQRSLEIFRKKFKPGDIVIHGDCRGADRCVTIFRRELGIHEVRVPYYDYLYKAGGMVRNKDMLIMLLGLKKMDYEIAVLAFHDNIHESKGTLGMIKLVLDAPIPVKGRIYTSKGSKKITKDLLNVSV